MSSKIDPEESLVMTKKEIVNEANEVVDGVINNIVKSEINEEQGLQLLENARLIFKIASSAIGAIISAKLEDLKGRENLH